MRDYGPDILLFFDTSPKALPLFEALDTMIRGAFPEAALRVQKTQITYYRRRVFACVSFARVKRKRELPDPYLVLTLGMPYPLGSERVAVKVEACPGRWTTHIVLGSKSDLDGELLGWLREAYAFSERKQAHAAPCGDGE